MKKLLGTIIGLSLAILFSVQAFAMQEQRRDPAPVQQSPQPVQTIIYYYPTPVQWYTHATQRVDVPYSQNSQQGTSNTGVAQQLKQFRDQTQKQMADFSKL